MRVATPLEATETAVTVRPLAEHVSQTSAEEPVTISVAPLTSEVGLEFVTVTAPVPPPGDTEIPGPGMICVTPPPPPDPHAAPVLVM